MTNERVTTFVNEIFLRTGATTKINIQWTSLSRICISMSLQNCQLILQSTCRRRRLSVYVEDGGSDGAVIWIGCSARRTRCHFHHLN